VAHPVSLPQYSSPSDYAHRFCHASKCCDTENYFPKRLRVERLGFDFRQGPGSFLLATASRLALWGQPRLLSEGYRFFPGGKEARSWMTTHLHIELRWRMCGAVPPLSQYAVDLVTEFLFPSNCHEFCVLGLSVSVANIRNLFQSGRDVIAQSV
jgi:hypothetical protein